MTGGFNSFQECHNLPASGNRCRWREPVGRHCQVGHYRGCAASDQLPPCGGSFPGSV